LDKDAHEFHFIDKIVVIVLYIIIYEEIYTIDNKQKL